MGGPVPLRERAAGFYWKSHLPPLPDALYSPQKITLAKHAPMSS